VELIVYKSEHAHCCIIIILAVIYFTENSIKTKRVISENRHVEKYWFITKTTAYILRGAISGGLLHGY
jgi:hypothetical protein